MAKKVNAGGEAKMRTHMRDVEKARKSLLKQTEDLHKSINSKIIFAEGQDRGIMKSMKQADSSKRKPSSTPRTYKSGPRKD